MNLEEGHQVVRCHGKEALERAKSLVNIQFSWYLIGVTIFGLSLYLILHQIYGERIEYESLAKYEEQEEENYDVESQKNSKLGESKSSVHMGKVFAPMDIER